MKAGAAGRVRRLLPHREPVVLLYHQVARTTRAEDPGRLAVSPRTFERQMGALARAGFRVRALDGVDDSTGGRDVFLSFDDGYLDTYAAAFPILQRHGFTATVFLATAHIGGARAWNGAGPAPMMSWSQAAEMARAGFSLQSHTRTHPNLTRCDDAAALAELSGSRAELEDRLGRPVDAIAYPHGCYDSRVLALAARAGYRSGWAAGLAEGGPLARERLQVSGRDNAATFAVKVSGLGCWLRRTGHGALALVGRGSLPGRPRP